MKWEDWLHSCVQKMLHTLQERTLLLLEAVNQDCDKLLLTLYWVKQCCFLRRVKFVELDIDTQSYDRKDV